MDFSTIDLDVLARCKKYSKPPTYQLQEGSGNGCSGDPPGYPTYFTRSVYTRHGNSPRNGPEFVITFQGVHYFVVETYDEEKTAATFKKLWKPLPIDHPRTRLWVGDMYRHFHHCYADHERPEYGRAGTLIYPVPDYKLKVFADDPRWNDAYRAAAQAEVEAFNKHEQDRAALIATPNSQVAVLAIQKYYPDYQPELELIENPPKTIGLWWGSEAAQPSEADCAKTQRWGKHHPMNGSFCQWCGRHYPA